MSEEVNVLELNEQQEKSIIQKLFDKIKGEHKEEKKSKDPEEKKEKIEQSLEEASNLLKEYEEKPTRDLVDLAFEKPDDSPEYRTIIKILEERAK